MNLLKDQSVKRIIHVNKKKYTCELRRTMIRPQAKAVAAILTDGFSHRETTYI